jgi:hypothetical protein
MSYYATENNFHYRKENIMIFDIIANDIAKKTNEMEMKWNFKQMKARAKDQDISMWKNYAERNLNCIENLIHYKEMEKNLEEKGSSADFLAAGAIEGVMTGTATAVGIVGVIAIASGIANMVKKRSISPFFCAKITSLIMRKKRKSAQEESCLDTSRLSSDERNVPVQRWFESTRLALSFIFSKGGYLTWTIIWNL